MNFCCCNSGVMPSLAFLPASFTFTRGSGTLPGHAVHGEVAIWSGHREIVVADRQVVDAILARAPHHPR